MLRLKGFVLFFFWGKTGVFLCAIVLLLRTNHGGHRFIVIVSSNDMVMDTGVIEVPKGNGQVVAGEEGDGETIEGETGNAESMTLHHAGKGMPEPYVGMEFDSEDAARIFYEDYARRNDFTSKVGSCRSKADGAVISRDFICAKEGLKRRQTHSCDAMIRVELKDHNKWSVTEFCKEHTHSTISPNKVHSLRPRRHFAGALKYATECSPEAEPVPSGVLYVSTERDRVNAEINHNMKNGMVESNHMLNVTWSKKAAKESSRPLNAVSVNCVARPLSLKRTLWRDAQNLLEYFKKMQAENPGFFYGIQLNEENHLINAFWADARSRAAYSHFGDVVTLDTTYRVYQYSVPAVPFTGVNHHGQTILFGCALLLDDSVASFIWLLKTFLTAMNDRPPISIVTDQDRAINMAVSQVFPEARHCISKWHVLREGQEKLAHVCRTHPTFQLDLYNCINLTETIEEFESSWNTIIDKYDLRRNDWLRALYDTRARWVPVYFRDAFFAAVFPSSGFDGSFFDGYINNQTALPLFFRQYEMALENSFQKEIEADSDTACIALVLKTPSPMEKQASNLYTRRIFAKFQEELVETFVYTANRIDGDSTSNTFRVAKFEDDQKAYFVRLNYSEMTANCSCQMFEYSGILCRHVLTVFTVTNVLTLPSHYILKRWTRNAKSRLDDQVVELPTPDSLSNRYNALCREAMKLADEGAVSLDTFNAAVVALRVSRKKISSVTNVHQTSQAGGIGKDDRSQSGASDMTPSLWPRQDEMSHQLNIKSTSLPAQSVDDLNVPHMAPVSLRRDDGLSENMVVLPCLKSMTWVMEKKDSAPGHKVAIINLKLQDYGKTSSAEAEVKFQLSKVTLEPMLRSMAYISEQLSGPSSRVAVINLKLQDAETSSGESEVRFQVSRDTLAAMLRSMDYIREQLSLVAEPQTESVSKRQRK